MDWADEAVTAALFRKQQQTEPVDPEPKTSTQDLQEEIDAVDARIDELHEAYNNHDLTLPEMLKLQKAEKAAKAELIKRQAESVVIHWGLLQPFDDFDAMNLSQRRGYVERFITNIMVYPPKNAKGKNFRDDSRLEVHYADGAVERLSNGVVVDTYGV